ncbi:MAG: hypothetical protein LBJ10_00280, partial [Clostridiales bacterium]|nr:hypothetical protein [Clostridiales bacterium]
MTSVTPMMRQYLDVKANYGDCILFFRLGDFYEMFFDDAILASRVLEITLTGKDCGQAERAPMCGVPYHAIDSYLPRLVAKGYKVAICEQMTDPALAKGIVERSVIRVVTPGTVTEPVMLEEKSNAYLMCVYKEGKSAGVAVTDLTTGVLYVTSILWGNVDAKLIDEISKYMPKEIVASRGFFEDAEFCKLFESKFGIYKSQLPDDYFEAHTARALIARQFPQYGGNGGNGAGAEGAGAADGTCAAEGAGGAEGMGAAGDMEAAGDTGGAEGTEAAEDAAEADGMDAAADTPTAAGAEFAAADAPAF